MHMDLDTNMRMIGKRMPYYVNYEASDLLGRASSEHCIRSCTLSCRLGLMMMGRLTASR